MSGAGDDVRLARAALTRLVEPGDAAMGALLREWGPVAVLDCVRRGVLPAGASPAAARRLPRWRVRLTAVDPGADLAAGRSAGARLVCPGDPEWPSQLEVLGPVAPYALWVRGEADLRHACLRSVSVVGARAATAYGAHVATGLGAVLGERGWTVVSGGAYGIDAGAHRGALAGGGETVVVLACGVDRAYPAGNERLFEAVAGQGVLVSEWPPATTPSRPRFLVRNRVIAALTRGTVVVEAALRSGAISTARHARDLGRPVMAVPGPVTSAMSEGCHKIIRDWQAVCVTRAEEVIETLAVVGDDLVDPRSGQVLPRDALDPTSTLVLEAVPARGAASTREVAVRAGVDVDTTVGRLGVLAAGGFVQRCDQGWRLRRDGPGRRPPRAG